MTPEVVGAGPEVGPDAAELSAPPVGGMEMGWPTFEHCSTTTLATAIGYRSVSDRGATTQVGRSLTSPLRRTAGFLHAGSDRLDQSGFLAMTCKVSQLAASILGESVDKTLHLPTVVNQNPRTIGAWGHLTEHWGILPNWARTRPAVNRAVKTAENFISTI